MCGRLNILADMLNNQVSDELRVRYHTADHPDLSPTQTIATVCTSPSGLQQYNMTWGIKPNWARKLLINAQVETALEKPTWRDAMQHRRCIIPCSGWYEWCDKGGSSKQKYLFSHTNDKPLYMAGIWFDSSDGELPELVTLTTAADAICKPYHHRMPLLIEAGDVGEWFGSSRYIEQQLLSCHHNQNTLKIEKVIHCIGW